MENLILGIVLVVMGSLAVAFRDKYARVIVAYQNRVFGYNFGEREVLISKFIAIIVGSAVAIIGVLSMLGKVTWQ